MPLNYLKISENGKVELSHQFKREGKKKKYEYNIQWVGGGGWGWGWGNLQYQAANQLK